MIYAYNLGLLVLKRQGDRVAFPPEDPLAMPKMWEEKLRALTAVADLLREGDFVNGWFPNIAGEYYFECRRNGVSPDREESCIALSSAQIFPTLFGVLDEFAAVTPGWAFRLRDSFDRIVWSRGEGQSFQAFTQSGALGRLALAAPLALVWLPLVFLAPRAHQAKARESAARMTLLTELSLDLRTPLANLKLYAELIRRKGEAPELSRYCAALTDEIDRLDALARATLAQGAAPAHYDLETADPGALAEKIVARYQSLLAASGSVCEMRGSLEGERRFATRAFERILINLVDNARKLRAGAHRGRGRRKRRAAGVVGARTGAGERRRFFADGRPCVLLRPRDAENGSRMKILIAEDHPNLRVGLADLLALEGLDCIAAEDGRGRLDRLRRARRPRCACST